MRFREVDAKLRSAFSLSALTLMSGFIGVSIAGREDSWGSAGLIFCLMIALTFLYILLNDDHDKGLHWWFVIFSAAFFGWIAAAALTDKPYLMASLFLSWIGCSVFFQSGKLGKDIDKSLDGIETSLDGIDANLQKFRNERTKSVNAVERRLEILETLVKRDLLQSDSKTIKDSRKRGKEND